MALLIQLTGAQGVGKTSLAKYLKAQFFSHCCMIGEVSRTLKAQKIIKELDVKASFMEQMLINAELLWQYFDRLGAAVTTNRVVIAERTPLDCLAYTVNLVGDESSKEYAIGFATKFFRSLEGFRGLDIKTFYIPPVIFFEEDGIRVKESQITVNGALVNILKELSVEYVTVPEGTTVDRASFIISKIC